MFQHRKQLLEVLDGSLRSFVVRITKLGGRRADKTKQKPTPKHPLLNNSAT